MRHNELLTSIYQILLFVLNAAWIGNAKHMTAKCYEKTFYDTNRTCKKLLYEARMLMPERICRYPNGWPYVAEEELANGSIQPGYLEIRQFQDKGRGIVTNVDIPSDSFVMYYHGQRLYREPHLDEHGNLYLYSVTIEDCEFWIDGSKEDESYSRLMNDNHIDQNIKVVIKHRNILFYTSRDVRAGEEITFDYGLDSEEYPWRQNIPRVEKKRRRMENNLMKRIGLTSQLVITS